MFVVLHPFRDKTDNNRYYHAGASFPRDGLSVSPERIAYLSGTQNRMQTPLIRKEDPAEKAEKAPKQKKKKSEVSK